MTFLILRAAPASLKGFLTRWFIEVSAGVFIGTLDSRVRQLVWERVQHGIRDGSAIMAWPKASEQGFELVSVGESTRKVIESDGLFLVRRTPAKRSARHDAEKDEKTL